MLIDATHPEETRVVVVNGTRLEELDVETSTKKQLKGNIYLAKIVRVEPSLQAAFVDYGGNRHGFLAFGEIHPDYFQIPVADRQALLAAQNADHFRENGDHGDGAEGHGGESGGKRRRRRAQPASDGLNKDRDTADAVSADESAVESADEAHRDDGAAASAVTDIDHADITVTDIDAVDVETGAADGTADHGASDHGDHGVEHLGGDDASEQELERRRARLLRNYKIQEVIKRRQIMLVQVVKEERGNKGAALTTYLSLAGRYCVLMPNTARGGGVSRKIVNAVDRKRLKSIAQEMEIPDSMAVIIRTAGSERSKVEIKRDYEYLLRMWDTVRELTLKSTAPTLVYEEASLIKRSIRDLYSRDIDEVLVDGDEGYRLAKDFMRMLTPSHAKKVQPYRDEGMPMFHRYQVESQLDVMHSPIVQLRSGGYIVLSQTEALVAIDVNSGRATRERHIEETALKTNLEAADEVARQLRLRDLAGLVVIDFIDMEESRNNHAVERRLKEALKNDRARIQVGRISPFGLLELSRQRLRPSLQETIFSPCPHCAGTGLIRSVESAAVHVLRAIEEEGIRRRSSEIVVTMPNAVALYILNQKRQALAAIEARYQFSVLLAGDDSLISPAYRLERTKTDIRPEESRPALPAPVAIEEEEPEDEESDAEAETAETAEAAEAAEAAETGDGTGDGGRRRRRRRRRNRGDQPSQLDLAAGAEDEAETDTEGDADDAEPGDEEARAADEDGEDGEEDDDQPRKRRRGRRGGRRRRRNRDERPAIIAEGPESLTADAVADVFEAAEAAEEAAEAARRAQPALAESEAPAQSAEDRIQGEAEPVAETGAAEAAVAEAEEAPAEKPKRRRATRKTAAATTEAADGAEPAAEKPKRKRAAPRKKTVAAEAEAPASEDMTMEAAEPKTVEAAPPVEPASLETPAAAPDMSPVVEPDNAEPAQSREQPAADTSLAAAAEPATDTESVGEPAPEEPQSPPRRGWWNRL
jgi:ribonuclease E